jgi:S1-C subfamily serine protease
MVEKQQKEEEFQVIQRVEPPIVSAPPVKPPVIHKQPREKRSPNGRLRFALLIVAIGLLTGFCGGMLGGYVSSFNKSQTTTVSKEVISSESQLISSIAKNVGASVVSIDVTTTTTQTDIFGQSYSSQGEAAGTGIIVSDSGYIVTNRHVVDSGTTKVSITLSDGTTLDDVSVVGRTSDSDSLDIAILKVNDTKGKTLKAATLGDSSKLSVGDKVVAIGNALGRFQNSVTAGIVSGYGRSIEAGDETGSDTEVLQNLIQTDAAINSGNSGGPLVNMSGEVIGINTAVASGSAQSIGFAIPINDVTGLINSVIKTGKFQRPYLGVRYVTLNDTSAYNYNLSVKRGAYLAPGQSGGAVVSGSPADKAGLKEKDIITKVDGTAIDENNSLSSLIGRKAVGDSATLTVIRDGKEISVSVTLGEYQ